MRSAECVSGIAISLGLPQAVQRIGTAIRFVWTAFGGCPFWSNVTIREPQTAQPQATTMDTIRILPPSLTCGGPRRPDSSLHQGEVIEGCCFPRPTARMGAGAG
jgi:hypothetical protein